MIERLAQRLKTQPNDGEGWRMLGWSYFGTGRFGDAASAYERAVAIIPQKAGLKTSWGEALVRAANGRVTPASLKIFDDALLLDAKDPRARFFKGLALEQSGDGQGALTSWLAVLKDASPNDAWAPELKQRVVELAGKLGKDISGDLAGLAQATNQTQAGAAQGGILDKLNRGQLAMKPASENRGPSAEDIQAAQTMTPTDRTAMIRGMVDGLAQRLEASPRDSGGWIKLMRSRMALGQIAEAKAALSKALSVFADAPAEQQRISAAAKSLGVTR
ncbi:MAG: TPR domain-containing protein [Aestuariivirgaceae bacterium]